MDKKKMSFDEFARYYAKKTGHIVDEEETARMMSLISDTAISLRLSSELKELVELEAKRQGIPYQRLIKNYIISGLKKSKAS